MSKQKSRKPFTPKFNIPAPAKTRFAKNFGMQARIQAMHSIQRASGRRGN